MESWHDEVATAEAKEWANRINKEPELHDRAVKFYNSAGQWPNCEESLLNFERKLKELLEQGEAASLVTGRFTQSPTCPKCRNNNPEKFHSHYIPADRAETECPHHVGVREHMHRGCDACQYHWVEFPADYEEG